MDHYTERKFGQQKFQINKNWSVSNIMLQEDDKNKMGGERTRNLFQNESEKKGN